MAEKEFENGSSSLEHKPPAYGDGDGEGDARRLHTRFFDSFKRDPTQHATPRGSIGGDGRVFDLEGAAAATAASPLARKLKGRHLQMIAIGGSIGGCIARRDCPLKDLLELGLADRPFCVGTGLFVGSGSALAKGGPASLLIAFTLIGGMLYSTVHALGEMAVLFPVAGSFAAYSTRFLDPAWGFAMGWK
jgi:amino acid transporter